MLEFMEWQGLLLSMASEEENRPDIRIETVPGVTAGNCWGGNTWCTADERLLRYFPLRPINTLERYCIAIARAAQGDFVICLYNPCQPWPSKALAQGLQDTVGGWEEAGDDMRLGEEHRPQWAG